MKYFVAVFSTKEREREGYETVTIEALTEEDATIKANSLAHTFDCDGGCVCCQDETVINTVHPFSYCDGFSESYFQRFKQEITKEQAEFGDKVFGVYIY